MIMKQPSWQITRKFGRAEAESQQGVLERDARVHQSKDVPWRIKCNRMVDQTRSTASFASDVKVGRRVERRWTRSKDGKLR